MRYMVLTSEVVDGHYIEDLQCHVPYDDTETVPYDRAKGSDDLQRGVERGHLQIIRISEGEPRQHDMSSASENETDDIDELKSMHRDMIESMHALISQQQDVIEQQLRLLESIESSSEGPDMDRVIDALSDIRVESSARDSESNPSGVQDDEPVFVPDQIRDDSDESSARVKVEEESNKSSSKLDEAAKLLEEQSSD